MATMACCVGPAADLGTGDVITLPLPAAAATIVADVPTVGEDAVVRVATVIGESGLGNVEVGASAEATWTAIYHRLAHITIYKS